MDWILLLKISAVIVAALLGVFGILYEHRKDGKLTFGGKLTIVLIILASVLAGILEAMMASDSRKQMETMLDGIDKTLKPIGDENTLSARLSGFWKKSTSKELEFIEPDLEQLLTEVSCEPSYMKDEKSQVRPLCVTDRNENTSLEGLLFCTDTTNKERFPFESSAKHIRLHFWVIKDPSENSIFRNWNSGADYVESKIGEVRRIGLYILFKPKKEENCRSVSYRYESKASKLILNTELDVEYQSADGSLRSYRDLEESLVIIKLEIWSEPQSEDMQAAQRNLISEFDLNLLEIELADGVVIPISAFDFMRLKNAYRKNGKFTSQVYIYRTPKDEGSLLGIDLPRKRSYGIPSVYGEAEYIQ